MIRAAPYSREIRHGARDGQVLQLKQGLWLHCPEDGGPDIFVHASALERSGIRELSEGDQVSFEAREDRRSGRLAATDLRVMGIGAASSGRPAPRSWDDGSCGQDGTQRSSSGPRNSAARPAGGSGRGTVKWFNVASGFGFIQPDDGSRR